MPLVYISAGSNLGDRKSHLESALQELHGFPDIRDLKCSPVYETEPVDGAEGQPRFWNAVWSFVTDLEPSRLLEHLQAMEAKAGRQRKIPKESRVLDLDILFYGDTRRDEKNLTIPHPRLHERGFVLAPFCDLAPEFIHPEFHKPMKQLLEEYRARHGGIRGVEKITESA